MMAKSNFLRSLLSVMVLLLGASHAFAQPAFTITPGKDACGASQSTSLNGSFTIHVTSVGDISVSGQAQVTVFGPTSSTFNISSTGDYPVSNLKGSGFVSNYQVTIIDDGGNFATVFTTVKFWSPPSVVVNSITPVTTCTPFNGAIDITPSGGSGTYLYAWTGPSGFTATTQDISGVAGGNYSVTVSDPNTVCTGVLSPITVPVATPSVTLGSIPGVCSGTTTSTLPYTAETGSPNQYTIDWVDPSFPDVGATPLPAVGTSITISGIPSVVTTTTFNGTLIAQNTTSGCFTSANSISVTVTANVTPAVSISANPGTTICAGKSVTFTATPTNGGTPTYQWKKNGGNVGTGNTYVDAGLVNSDQISVVMTSTATCATPTTANDSKTMTVNPLPSAPTVNFSPSTYCVGKTITAPTVSSPVGTSTYKWYSDAGLTTQLTTANGTAPTNTELGFNTTTAHSTTVYVAETTSSGCQGPATAVTLTVNANPVAPTVSFSPSTYCVGQTVTPPTVSSPVGTSTYKWYSDAGLTTQLTTANGTAPTNAELGFNTTTAHTTTVYVAETNSNGCQGPATTVTLTVKTTPAAPTVNFSPSTYCVGKTITAPTISSPVGTSTYKWYSDAGLTTQLTTANGTAPTNTELGFNTTTAHTTTVYVAETNSGGCQGPATTVTLTVVANPVAPTVNFSPSTYCVGQTITPPTVSSPVGTSTYKWYSDAGLTTQLTTANGTAPTNAELGFNTTTVHTTTVYVAETNSSGCQGPATTVTLTVNITPAAPTVNFTPNTYCVGKTITPPTISSPVGTSTYKWYSDAGLTSLLTTANGTAPTNAELGFNTTTAHTTTVYVTETNSGGCQGPATAVTLTVNPAPSAPTVSFAPSSYCVGQTINAPTVSSPVGTSTYKWYSDAGLTTQLTTANGTAPTNAELGFNTATAHITTLYVAETNSGGCQGPATTVTLTVNVIPVAPAVSFSPSTYCVGQTITPPTVSSPVGTSTYKWYSDAGLTTQLTTANGTAPTNTELGFNTTTAHTTTVYVAETNSSNCQGPGKAVTLTVNANPVAPTISFSPNTYCVGQTITAPTISSPVGTSTYKWYSDAGLTTQLTTANGTAPTNAELGFNTTAAHTTTVYVAETNSGGCQGPATTVTLTVNANPVAPTISFSPSTYCVGQTITAPTVSSPVGTSTYKWYSDAGLTTQLTTANGTAPTNAELGFNTTTAHTTTVYVAETNSSNCQGPATTVTLTVIALPAAPTVNFTPSNYCVGQTIAAPTISSPVGTSTYKWYSDAALTTQLTTANGTAPTNAELGFNTTTAHSTTVYVTETIASGCQGPAKSVTLTVNANPVAPTVSFSPSTYCAGKTITAPTISSPVGTSTYKWYSDAGLTTQLTTANGTAPTNAELGFNTTTAHSTTVYVAETNNSGCQGPATTVTLTVNPTPSAPTVTFNPSFYCVGQTITAPTVSSPVGTSTYKWYSDSGLTTQLTTASGTAPTNAELGFNTTTAHTTTVYVTETNNSGCQGPATSVILTVSVVPSAPTINFTSNNCVGQTIIAPTVSSPVSGSTYKWYSDVGLTTLLSTVNGTAPTNAELGFNSTTVHSTTVYVTETNSGGCQGPATTVTLTVNPTPPAPTVNFTPSAYCVGQTITAPTVSSPVGTSTYTWYSNVTLTTQLTTADGTAPTNAELGFHTVTAHSTTVYVTETNNSGCRGPATAVTLTVNAKPTATITGTTTICSGSNATLTITLTGAGPWNFSYSDGTTTTSLTNQSSNPFNFNVSPIANTTYSIVSVSDANCTGTAGGSPATVSVDSPPDLTLGVTANVSPLCSGNSTTIDVANSESGVSYQLRTGATNVGSAVIGTGGTINLSTGNLTTTTTFNVLAKRGVCPAAQLTNTASVTVAGAINAGLTVAAQTSPICSGSGTNIQVSNSEIGVNYQLRDNSNNSIIGSAVAGTGSTSTPIDLPTGNLTATKTFNVLASNGTCSAQLTTTANVNVGTNPNPNLTLGSTISAVCSGGSSNVTVANSEVGVSYQLIDNSNNNAVGSPVVGTGNTINLPTGVLSSNMTYNVLATGGSPCAPVQLTGTVSITVGGSVNAGLTITDQNATVCSGSGTNIQIAASENGVNYQLQDTNNNNIGTAVAGTGASINLPTGNLSANSTFVILASNGTCSIQMTTSPSVNVDSSPNVALATSASIDPVCNGGSSDIQVANSEIGVSYQLRDASNVNVGSAVAGTGNAISLPTGALAATTTFNVLATHGVCPAVQLTNTVTVTVAGSINAGLTISAQASPICSGTGTNIQIAASENGVNYQLRDDSNNSPIGTAVAGTGASIDLPTGNLAISTTFNILASNGACSIVMTTKPAVTVNAGPNAGLGVTPQSSSVCSGTGTNIQVSSSENGVSYQLRDNSNNSSIGTVVVGNGSTINLPTGSLSSNTTFNVFATSGSCSIQLTATATVNVLLPTDPLCTSSGGIYPVPIISKVDACSGNDGQITFTSVSGGTPPYQYSIDNGAHWQASNSFTLLAGGTYSALVMDAASTPKLSTTYTIVIAYKITGSITKTDVTSCTATDGTITISNPQGGTGPYSYSIDGGATFPYSSSPITGLAAAAYSVVIKDNTGGCISAPASITVSGCTTPPPVNCGVFTITATDTRPTCAGQDDGTITITVSGGSPNYVVTLTDPAQGFSQALTGPGPFSFGTGPSGGLSPSLTYQYTVKDNANNTCTLPYSLPIQTNVQATASGFVDAQCYNQPVGQATLTVTSGGTSPYEYSLDAGATWVSFTSPATITNLMPAATPYSILVRDGATDQCPAQVSVTIGNAANDILITSTSTDASCVNNDGSIQITSVSGGNAPYTYQFNGTSTSSLSFGALAAGGYTFSVTDALGCSKNFPFTISSPGYAAFTATVTGPTCLGGGSDGKIDVQVSTSGNFDIGITTDPNNDPSPFQFLSRSNISTPVTFTGLSQGTYRVVVKPNGALCSTPQTVVINSGPVAVDFDLKAKDFFCYETKGTVKLFNIKGSTYVDYIYEIIDTSVGSIYRTGLVTQLQALDTATLPLPDPGLDKGNYRVRLYQDQSGTTGCITAISSAYKDFAINGPTLTSFDTLSVVRTVSQYSLATGTMAISLNNMNAPRYQWMLKLVAPEITGQDNSHNVFDSQWVTYSSTGPIVLNAIDLYAGAYQLSIRDSIGCLRSYPLNISLDAQVFIPNIFTPNNDNKNDNFEILYLPANSKITITNRWGKQVLSGSSFPLAPDGITSVVWNGGSESDGIYFYTLNTPSKTYTGWVELKR